MIDNKVMWATTKSSEIFQMLSNSAIQMMKRRRFRVLSYFDDVLGICSNYMLCIEANKTLTNLF